jgi:hypothetical protein
MQKFQMCLPVGNNEYLVPELLAADPPTYNWDYKNNVRFELSYKFMPAGLMTHFIWRMYDMLEVYWKSGAVVAYKDTRLLLRMYIVERKVSFWIQGKNCEELLNFVRWEFDKIHKDILDPPFKEMFPCNCSECKDSPEPEFFSYQQLEKFLKKNLKEIQCKRSGDSVPINPLFGRFNGDSPKTSFFEYLLRAVKKLQGLRYALDLGDSENNRNSFIANELDNADFFVKDQSLYGISPTGKQAGEIDILVENKNKEVISLLESMNLDSLHTAYINQHVQKLFSYDTTGLSENYILVYSESKDFVGFWKKYLDYIPNIELPKCKFISIQDISEDKSHTTEVKIARVNYNRMERTTTVYHLFINLYRDGFSSLHLYSIK